jgi:hypothetical protein
LQLELRALRVLPHQRVRRLVFLRTRRAGTRRVSVEVLCIAVAALLPKRVLLCAQPVRTMILNAVLKKRAEIKMELVEAEV